MLNRITALLATAAFLVCSYPHSARAAASSAPVSVQGCGVNGKWGRFDVNFTNASPQTITKVRFALMTMSGPLAMVDDVGSYAPGEIVKHRLGVDRLILQMDADIRCVPASVTYQDGTTWQNPSQPSDMEQALPQTPGSQIVFSRCFIGDGADMWYHSTASQDATEVDLGVVQHGYLVYELDDKGTVEPNVLKQRGAYSEVAKGTVVGDDVVGTRCIALAVHYADGTSWSNPARPPQAFDGIPFAVPTADANAPVTVSGCDGSSATGDNYGMWRIVYANSSSKPIVAADFALVMHGKLEAAARDLHNLDPGGISKPQFLQWDPHVYHPACIPVRVSFADGTYWINPFFTPDRP